MSGQHMATEQATIADTQAAAGLEFDIVLKPVSHPELGNIRIDENLFAIGRTEPPFDAYPPEVVADLSRRHARIFSEHGGVYIADLDSKNGTTVNGVNVQQKITRLHDGDEICFGGTLSYRVHLGARAEMRGRVAKLVSLTLTPERGDLGLQPIVITRFPFLISKADEVFARYKDDYPHQVNYISRRHAHIFLKGGSPFVEDLGSTNGTFVAGKRLDEHAMPLEDGDVLAFGGHHFVYKVSQQKEESDPTITKLSPAVRPVPEKTADADKTTFVAAADSFLDIFCVDHVQQQDDELNAEELKAPDDAAKEKEKHPPRSRFAIFSSELIDAFVGKERKGMKQARWVGAGLVALLVVFALALYFTGSDQREVKDMFADGEYAKAAAAADDYLEHDPENAEVRAMGSEALLKAHVPKWLALLKARNFDQANAALAEMGKRGRHNSDVQPLVNQLAWMGNMERFISTRGGPDAPVRIYADEDRIKSILRQWDEDPQGHQRALDAVASAVPEFRDSYAEALSHLRKLQSDDAVYLAAIERLKGTIGDELKRDQPENLDAVLKDYAEKYPRLGGLDAVRQDLRQYTEAEKLARERKLGQMIALQGKARFSTPPFQEKFRALASSNRYPPAPVVQQYQESLKAWRGGDTGQAFAGLQKMGSGAWGDAAAKELERKKSVADQYAALQKSRDAKDYDERLLAFYGALIPDEDTYFVRAIEPDVGRFKDKALSRARDLAGQAEARWRQYRDNGPIEGEQRLETRISDKFRNQARLLSEARDDARKGMGIYAQLKTDAPAQWKKLNEDIKAEADAQRKGLLELRNVLEPGLLKAKLALLGSEEN
ncbi:FHA domain-containing protein [Herbaspirillum sp. ST 5-3]|uniref:FHA domain-containing protein n=1 Tax=Oxalobacteraceae TaxID=75682 RepID=UPI0032B772BF